MNILATIKASTELRQLADTGRDDLVADTIAATLPKPVPITKAALRSAMPTTLASLSLADAQAVMAAVGSAEALLGWCEAASLVGKMSDAEYDAVTSLIAAAAPIQCPTHQQVTEVLNAVRPRLPQLTGPLFYIDGKSEFDEHGVIVNGTPILDENGVQRIGVTRDERIDGSSPIDWSKV